MAEPEYKTYLGDGVYLDFDSATQNLVITTEDGIRATNKIIMEPEVFRNFLTAIHKIKEKYYGGT